MSFPLPPLSLGLSSATTSASDLRGSAFGASGAGDWTINMAGSGTSLQGAAGGSSSLLMVLIVAGAFLLWKK